MSAYICNPEHFAALAAFAAQERDSRAIQEWRSGNPIETARMVAVGLAKENIRSVCHRYPDSAKSGDLPGPIMPINDLVQKAADLAEKYFFQTDRLGPIDIIKMCDGLAYQSCETDDWHTTPAYRQLDRIRSAATRKLPGKDGKQVIHPTDF